MRLRSCQSQDKAEIPIKSPAMKTRSRSKLTDKDLCATSKYLRESLYKTPEFKQKEFQPSCRKSTLDAWNRAFQKTSPTTETLFSPVKASQANLKKVPFVISDKYIDIFLWIVNMSEQFFYDNTLIMLNAVKTEPDLVKNRLRHNYQEFHISFFRNLKQVTLLGGGSFGKVFSAVDETTRKKYAIKFLEGRFADKIEHCGHLLDYMTERNSLIRASNSPFVMDFYYSLQIKSINGLFLFFEFCIGDLNTYVTKIKHKDFFMISRRINEGEPNIIQDLDKEVNVLDVSLMYIFEMFCGLDFLARVNIIHQDIKPENLMVSETLHLKIGDFGLIYRTRTIHRDTNKLLVSHGEIDTSESSNYELDIVGSLYYKDFEIKLMELEDQSNPLFNEVMDNSRRYDVQSFYYDKKVLKTTFLVDTWAAGVVCINLLFRGFDIFDPKKADPKILLGVSRTSEIHFLIHLVARKIMYKKYIYNGLINSGGESLKELMEFIVSIFRPRSARAKEYTKAKMIYRLTKKSRIKYIDIEKVEKLKPFQERKFSSTNIFTLAVPEKIRNFFETSKKPIFSTFEEFLETAKVLSKGEELLNLKPGLPINFFRKFH